MAGGTPACGTLRFCFAKPQSRASPYQKSSKHSKNCKPFFGCPYDFRHGSCLTRKRKALCTQFVCKGRMSRGTTFSYACLSRISQGSFNVDRTGRLTVKFSLPVQKLPSIPAFLQIPLSLSGISLWRCSGMYSSFSQPFSFFAIVCIIAEDFSFVKREFSSVLRYMPRSHLFPAWSRQKKE